MTFEHKPNIHTRDDEAFRFACYKGHINMAQLLYGLDDKPNIHALDDYAFRYACENGHINIAQWLYGLDDKPNIHANDDEAFKCACIFGHINIAQWLVSICDKYYIEIKNDIINYRIIENISIMCDDETLIIHNTTQKRYRNYEEDQLTREKVNILKKKR
jgi:hypothetical protein